MLRYIRIFDVCFCVDGDGVALEVGWVFVSFCVIVIILVEGSLCVLELARESPLND